MDNEKINKAIEKLQNGATLLYPTDTIWGIGCDATNNEACLKIMALKNRAENKSFVLLMDSFRMVEHYVPDFAPVVYDLVDLAVKPLTIIYPLSRHLAPSTLANDGSIAIRITKDPLCLQLIRGLKKPLVSTSANLSGNKFGKSYAEIDAVIKNEVDFCLDERTEEQLETPSQIIKVDLDGQVKIIRQ